jgi:hypothetical protein
MQERRIGEAHLSRPNPQFKWNDEHRGLSTLDKQNECQPTPVVGLASVFPNTPGG